MLGNIFKPIRLSLSGEHLSEWSSWREVSQQTEWKKCKFVCKSLRCLFVIILMQIFGEGSEASLGSDSSCMREWITVIKGIALNATSKLCSRGISLIIEALFCIIIKRVTFSGVKDDESELWVGWIQKLLVVASWLTWLRIIMINFFAKIRFGFEWKREFRLHHKRKYETIIIDETTNERFSYLRREKKFFMIKLNLCW